MIILQKYLREENNKKMKNYIITGVVEKPRHTIRITVSDSIYRKIKYFEI